VLQPYSVSHKLAGDRARQGRARCVRLVTAYPDIPRCREPITGSARRARVDLHEVAESVLARGAKAPEADGSRSRRSPREGDPAATLIELAEEQEVDLIHHLPR
jgi:nucleotide-binding universal stress UspA family protein